MTVVGKCLSSLRQKPNLVTQAKYFCYKPVSRKDDKDFKPIRKPVVEENRSLGEALKAKIQTAGPITVAEYMKQVLTNPAKGYYMGKDMFGQQGDYITSPEITQLFGEMIAVWIINELQKIGNPRPLQLIELGPGKGTLMKDILQVLRHFKHLYDTSIHFVEVSPYLATIQAQNICSNSDVNTGISPYNPSDPHKSYHLSGITEDGIHVYWYNRIDDIPTEFSVILAHEFFDALPIHKFQKTEAGWREVMIQHKSDHEFDMLLSKGETPMSKVFIQPGETREHVEVCPEAGIICQHIAARLEQYGGFSLFVDYGHDGEKTDTFRAFKAHKLHNPLVDPGAADLTADVDFSFLRTIVKDKLITYGPVNQGDFLKRLGIETRLNTLLAQVNNEHKKLLKSAFDMIVSNDQMGERFKCFAMFPKVLHEHLSKFPVAGFSDN